MTLVALVERQMAEWDDIMAALRVTPKPARKDLLKEVYAIYTRHAQEVDALESTAAQAAEAPVPPNPFKSLPPVGGIFDQVVHGENHTAFMQIEYLVNEMRENMSTFHLGLYGPPSCGKTMTAGIVARALERRYYEGNASFLSEFPNPIAGLVTLISRMHDDLPVLESYLHEDGRSMVDILAPSVFFVDEAHDLPIAVQYALLPITEKPYRTPYGEGYLDFRHIMFIFGTTDPAHLFKPLRTRCEPVPFVGYSAESVASIVKGSYPTLSMDDCLKAAKAGKLYPRRALAIARTCAALEAKFGSPGAVLEHHFGIDQDGLDATDRRILAALDDSVVIADPRKVEAARRLLDLEAQGGKLNARQKAEAETLVNFPRVHRPVGKQALAEKIMSTDTRDIFERVTYLEILGLVSQSSRGVQLTPRK